MYSTLITLTICLLPGSPDKLYGGRTLEHWQQRLGDLDPSDPNNESVVPPLIQIIQDEELPSDVRRPFAMTLGRMGPNARQAIPVLVDHIERRHELDKPTYAWAARALGLYGDHARQAVPALVELLFDEDIPQGYRTLPIEALARIGSNHPDVLPAMIRLLQYQGIDADKVTPAEASVFRELAAEALSVIGPEGDLAAPLLVRAVRSPVETEAVKRKAIVALGAMGGRAGLAVPALVEIMELEQASALRVVASEALGKIGAPSLPILQRYLRHPDAEVRRYTTLAFRSMGDQARQAIPALAIALSDTDAEVRINVCETMESLSAPAASYVPQLIQLLASDDRQVRMRSMRLLIKLGPAVRPFLGKLAALENHESSATRAIARKTLKTLQQ